MSYCGITNGTTVCNTAPFKNNGKTVMVDNGFGSMNFTHYRKTVQGNAHNVAFNALRDAAVKDTIPDHAWAYEVLFGKADVHEAWPTPDGLSLLDEDTDDGWVKISIKYGGNKYSSWVTAAVVEDQPTEWAVEYNIVPAATAATATAPSISNGNDTSVNSNAAPDNGAGAV